MKTLLLWALLVLPVAAEKLVIVGGGQHPPAAKIKQYANWFKIDKLCAVLDLQQLGHNIDPEYVEVLRASRQRATPANTDQPFRETEQDEYFAHIAGYTSEGFPYGISWDDWSQLDSEIYDNDVPEAKALKVNLPEHLRRAIEMRATFDGETVEQTVLRLLALGLRAANLKPEPEPWEQRPTYSLEELPF